MPDTPELRPEQRRRRRPRRLIGAFYSPNSYGLVLLLILFTYVLSVTLTSGRAISIVVAVQIATIWVVLRASEARRGFRVFASALVAISAIVAIANAFIPDEVGGNGAMALVSALLYLGAPFSVVRHLVMRRAVDRETVLGAVAAYLMMGMFFAFAYRALGAIQVGPFFGTSGDGTFPQDLFFSFTTLTTTGYGNLIPARNPGQSFAVLEMLIGQLFLVTAVAKAVNAWQPQHRENTGGHEDDR
jgi:Ion channel